jgi:hypothetical protein
MFSRGVASIEQLGSGMQVTIAQESGPSPQFQDFMMPTSEKHQSHSANTVQESTVFALIKENNKYLR